jgi:serine/threonine protein kinase/Tfp pilus assembly protein PilF
MASDVPTIAKPGSSPEASGAPAEGHPTAPDRPAADAGGSGWTPLIGGPAGRSAPELEGPTAPVPSISPPGQEPDSQSAAPSLSVSGVQQLAATLEKGQKLGRYMLLDKLGEGGMGVVYAAYDPELDRKVALKILAARISAGGPQAAAAAQARLLREAQAMARVKHPNVITVYDVGTIGDQVFVAMELVDGGTLGRWFRNTPRTYKEILHAFTEAGKGLAAAHAAGLVHRDFKPDNVLVSQDGRVQVTDFGLARLVSSSDEDTTDDLAAQASEPRRTDTDERRLIETQLTQVGAVVGTPAYMPPEQHLGQVPDARSDQFSFCAALYFALFTVRPFDPQVLAAHAGRVLGDGNTSRTRLERPNLRRERAASLGKGIIRDPPREPKVPAFVKQVLMRGLAVDPADRFDSMEALLAQLHREPRLQQRRLLGGVGAALAAAVALLVYQGASQRSSMCRGAERKLEGIWDEPSRDMVVKQFQQTGKAWAAEAAQVVQGRLDRYAADWSAMFQEACEATRLRGVQTEAVMSLRMICLDRRLKEIRELTHLMRTSDQSVLARSVDAVHALSSLSGCADVAALTSPISLPEDAAVRAQIEEVETRLAKVKALHDAGKFKPALELAQEAATTARAIGWPPLEAQALRWLGWLQGRTGEYSRGELTLRDAINAAEAGRADEERLRVLTYLVFAVGISQGRFEEGLQWSRSGEALLRRIGGNEELEMDLQYRIGSIFTSQGKHEKALPHYQRAYALADRVLDKSHQQRGRILGSLADTYGRLGDREEALKLMRQALSVLEEAVGREHPSTAFIHNNLAQALSERKDYRAALEHIQKAIRVTEVASGAEHPKVADYTDNLGTILQKQGRFEEALERALWTLEVRKKALREDHPDLGYSYENIGLAQVGLGRPEQAVEALERSLELREGVAPADLAEARFALARSLWQLNRDRRRARALAEEAHQAYQDAGDKERAQEIARWLQDRPESK